MAAVGVPPSATGMFLFIHIPKTAGTSFRTAAASLLGPDLYLDYGPRAPATSKLVRTLTSHPSGPRVDELVEQLRARRAVMLAGHVQWNKYAKHFAPEDVITFVRDPVERVVSAYHHAVRHLEYRGTLLAFARSSHHRNKQSRCLDRLPLGRVGVLGLSERYDDSLRLVEARCGLTLPSLVHNVNPARPSKSTGYELSPEQRADLEELNHQDLELYERARALFEIRLNDPTRGDLTEHVRSAPRGTLGGLRNGHLVGWAVLGSTGQGPARVELYVNGRLHSTHTADAPRPDLVRAGLHTTDRVGIYIPVGDLAAGTEVRLVIAGAGAELRGSPLLLR